MNELSKVSQILQMIWKSKFKSAVFHLEKHLKKISYSLKFIQQKLEIIKNLNINSEPRNEKEIDTYIAHKPPSNTNVHFHKSRLQQTNF